MSDEARENAKQLSGAVMGRDRRRIRRLAVITVGLWLLAGLLIPSVYLPLGAKVKKYVQLLESEHPGVTRSLRVDDAKQPEPMPTAAELPDAVARLQYHQWIMGEIIIHQWMVGAFILVMALGAGILASASTVALAFTIRGMTLRQINESLAEISEQLRQLQRGSSGLQ